MAQSFANVLALLRKTFARETLPEPLPEPPPRRPGPGALRLILGAEALPEDPVREAPARGQGLAAALFGPEELPLDPPGPARPLARWAAWLFAPERLDRDDPS